METTRNRSAILAQFLRNATFEIRTGGDKDNALASIDAVAETLENVAALPAHSPEPRDINTTVDVSRQDPVRVNENRVGEREPLTDADR